MAYFSEIYLCQLYFHKQCVLPPASSNPPPRVLGPWGHCWTRGRTTGSGSSWANPERHKQSWGIFTPGSFRAFVSEPGPLVRFGIYEHCNHAWIRTKAIGSRSADRGGLSWPDCKLTLEQFGDDKAIKIHNWKCITKKSSSVRFCGWTHQLSQLKSNEPVHLEMCNCSSLKQVHCKIDSFTHKTFINTFW